jgi:hypothetical protein
LLNSPSGKRPDPVRALRQFSSPTVTSSSPLVLWLYIVHAEQSQRARETKKKGGFLPRDARRENQPFVFKEHFIVVYGIAELASNFKNALLVLSEMIIDGTAQMVFARRP